MRKTLFTFTLLLFTLSGVSAQTRQVLISTNLGDITVMLYDETPNHRDNFVKLVNSGHFDGTLFYRVVKNFVVQGGSSDSRNAAKGKHIGYGYSAVTINSEFSDSLFHKKGALCAPRQPDEINMFKKSDVSQFYFAVGRVYTDEELDIIENNHNIPIKKKLKQDIYLPRKAELAKLKESDPKAYNELLREIKQRIAIEYELAHKLEFTKREREAYTTIGGIPDLDGNYTVFGEIIKGMDVLDKIAALSTDKNDRPYTDVKIFTKVIK